jgi:hypothetical protein
VDEKTYGLLEVMGYEGLLLVPQNTIIGGYGLREVWVKRVTTVFTNRNEFRFGAP